MQTGDQLTRDFEAHLSREGQDAVGNREASVEYRLSVFVYELAVVLKGGGGVAFTSQVAGKARKQRAQGVRRLRCIQSCSCRRDGRKPKEEGACVI
jgi:hypothetical protein